MSSHQEPQVVSLHICVGHRESMRVVDSANVVTGFGIEGDRHATSEAARKSRQVLLMDEDVLTSFGLSHGDVRENITTSGIALHSLPTGQRLALGAEVVLELTGHCTPCPRMDEVRMGLQQELVGQRGMLSLVVQGGTVQVGDKVRVLEGATSG